MAYWADLPFEILDEILSKLHDIEDFIRFAGVCHSWKSASVESKKTSKKSWCPWLMHSETVPREMRYTYDGHSDLPRKFLNLSNKKTIEFYLPEARRRKCMGFNPFGWVLTLGQDLDIHLLNPLTHLQISLPSQSNFKSKDKCYVDLGGPDKVFIRKFALSSHPNHHGCSVMVIYSSSGKLAIASPNDKAWTTIKDTMEADTYNDVIFYKNAFYAIREDGRLSVCDITTPVPNAIDIMLPPPCPERYHMYYLVEISGDLHMIVRIDTPYEAPYRDFQIHKLDFCKMEWIELQNINNYALFLSGSGAFAISTSEHPELRSNSIYLVNDLHDIIGYDSNDMEIIDFQDKELIEYFRADGFRVICSAPLIFVPDLY